MKKMFVLIAAAVALTACGGTVADEQSELQTQQGALTDLEGAPGITCEGCNCNFNPPGCGWYCGKSWSSSKQAWVYYTATRACRSDTLQCVISSYRVNCTTPCVEGTYSYVPCS
jgi:hypothetical protein